MKENKRLLAVCSLLLAAALIFTACSAGSSRNQAAASSAASHFGGAPAASEKDFDRAEAAPAPEAPRDAGSLAGGGIVPGQSTPSAPLSERKIITTYDLNVETTEFEAAIDYINNAAAQHGGYVESSSVQGRSIQQDEYQMRSARFTLRIPSGSVGTFVAELGDQYNVIYTDESSDDITDSYYDVKARLASLQEQENQLKTLLEKDGDLQYILEVHREIANVRYQIESLYSTIQRMDKSVDFSTCHISLQEVMVYKPVDTKPLTFGQRVSQAISNSMSNFKRSVQDSMISVIWSLPFWISNLFTLAVIVALILLVRRAIRRRRGLKPGERTFGPVSIRQPEQAPAPKAAEPPKDEEKPE